MSRQEQGYLFLGSAMVLVGSTVIASKIIAAGLPPFTATAVRFLVALPFFVVLMRLTGAKWPDLERRDWVLLLLQAGAGSVGYTTLLISGLTLTSAADAGVVLGTLPIVSATIAIVVLGERPDRRLLMAIALAAIGVFSITYRSENDGTQSLIGNALILGAVVCEGLFILLNKRLRATITPMVQSTFMTGMGLVISAIPAFFEQPSLSATTMASLMAVVYYALVPTVGGFLLWYAGAARVSGSEASLFTALAPVSAVVFAVLLLGESIGMAEGIGIACVLAAVLVTALSSFADRHDGAEPVSTPSQR